MVGLLEIRNQYVVCEGLSNKQYLIILVCYDGSRELNINISATVAETRVPRAGCDFLKLEPRTRDERNHRS